MALKNVTPIKRSEKILESGEGKVLVQSVNVVLPESNVQEALSLYRQNQVYAFVNQAVNLWTD